MDDQAIKIQRSGYLIKALMLFVMYLQVAQYYQTNILDFGEIAATFGILCFFRGLLLNPLLLASPLKSCFKSGFRFTKSSYKYFLLAVVLIAVGAL
ncbi:MULTISPECIES: hypothetical protein [unclassified Pseudoalteromonas]|uniref:hypothetical protein n=1 Tax=unclassified Pseudoalteromonas TaxID=194690 RepID=UPI000B3BFD7B|nr:MULTISPECIES: hypothetical protein [unclassified Pseudoalteromonas]MDN3377605.1 hypothetical protein [Pseudoalteromonas sp. APC 3893]MDN3385801.1 hypothetical protein [Pseudoalteromonas sp. APC 4017]OUS72780.1 hypothetical protein B5G52_06205 [Pseudoalteromonas sp. A601]